MNKEVLKLYITNAIAVIVILFIFYVINKIIDQIIKKILKRRKNKNLNTILTFFRKLKTIVIYTIAVIVALSRFSIFKTLSITVLSGLGIVATVAGLAAKDVLTDFFCSLGLVFSGPFEIDDFIFIEEKGISGTVIDITMRHTIIKTLTNERVIIPNSVMNSLSVKNYHRGDAEICMYGDYPISYTSDVDKATKIIKEEMEKLFHPTKKNIEFPKVRLHSWDSSGITLRSWIWGMDRDDALENLYKMNYAVKKRFEKEGIEIPYEYLNVIMDSKTSKKK